MNPNDDIIRAARRDGVTPATRGRGNIAAFFLRRLREERAKDPTHCGRCGEPLVDDNGASWPYCPVCDWCPDCGTAHAPPQ